MKFPEARNGAEIIPFEIWGTVMFPLTVAEVADKAWVAVSASVVVPVAFKVFKFEAPTTVKESAVISERSIIPPVILVVPRTRRSLTVAKPVITISVVEISSVTISTSPSRVRRG